MGQNKGRQLVYGPNHVNIIYGCHEVWSRRKKKINYGEDVI